MRANGSEPSSIPSTTAAAAFGARLSNSGGIRTEAFTQTRDGKGRISVTREVSANFLVSVWGALHKCPRLSGTLSGFCEMRTLPFPKCPPLQPRHSPPQRQLLEEAGTCSIPNSRGAANSHPAARARRCELCRSGWHLDAVKGAVVKDDLLGACRRCVSE